MGRLTPTEIHGLNLKHPTPANMISIVPGGLTLYQQMIESAGGTFDARRAGQQYIQISQTFGVGKKFRDYMFNNYSAEIVRHDGETMIRFIDEQMMLMFILKYGA